MTTERMTVHKALAELKLLDDRILKTIKSSVFCVANKHSNQKIGGVDLEEYKNSIYSGYDKAVSLIARRKAIKKAVVLSNAVTKVKIGGVEYTVAEAIEMKNHGIDFEGTLMDAMKMQYEKAMIVIKNENGNDLEERADKYVTAIYGQKEGKSNGSDIEKVREDFLISNQYELVDPLGVLERIEELETWITSFLSEVDAALSVSNALTEIEISY